MGTPLIQPSFAAGELAPALHARVDLAKYHIGLATCLNWMIMAQGGVQNRPGTLWVGPCLDHAQRSRLIPFQFNTTQAYALEFVQRQRFRDAYPTAMSPAEFVDALNARAGGALSPSERNQLVAGLAANDTEAGRAVALRKVAEDEDLRRAEFSRAFVLMQYYGYLRRNPDDPQDVDFGGWKFWLDKLNQFNGNFIHAEMVKAFINSNEYRRRFDQP